MTKFAWVGLFSLLSSVILGVLAPMMIFALMSIVDPDASDKWDGIYYFPILCALFIVGPIAAGLAARFLARKVTSRIRAQSATSQDEDGCLANVAGIMAVALSWLFVATGWIYDLLGIFIP